MGYSSTSLSKGQHQREQAREICLGDSYGYSETCMATPGATALSGTVEGSWGGEEIPVPCSLIYMKRIQC